MREATAMVYRAETEIDHQTVFIGVRSAGQVSVYWGSDPVWQFDRCGRLRRAFWRSHRVVAAAEQIYWTRPLDRGGKVRMERTAISEDEQRTLLYEVNGQLAQLLSKIEHGPTVWKIAIPPVELTHQKLCNALAGIHLPVQIATDGGVGS